ncbi:hypothetical protein [Palleronia sp.]
MATGITAILISGILSLVLLRCDRQRPVAIGYESNIVLALNALSVVLLFP